MTALLTREAEELRQQRDELLAALKGLLDADRADPFAIVGTDRHGHAISAPGAARIAARAAIAKVESAA